jgi:hypothetical protein
MDKKNLEKTRRAATACKAWVTRSTDTLSTLLKDKELDIVWLKHAILEVERRLAALDKVQAELELTVPEDEMLQCISDTADFRDVKLATLLQGRKVVEGFNGDIRLKWARECEDKEADLHYPVTFLPTELKRLTTSESLKENVDKTSIPQLGSVQPTSDVTTIQATTSVATLVMTTARSPVHTALPIIQVAVVVDCPCEKNIEASVLLDSGSGSAFISGGLVGSVRPQFVSGGPVHCATLERHSCARAPRGRLKC